MIGDSITQGLMRSAAGVLSGVVTPPNGAVLTEGSYGPELSELVSDMGCQHVRAFNWGVGGENAGQIRQLVQTPILSSLDAVAGDNSLNFALIMVGANDAFDMSDVSDVVRNIDRIISAVRLANVVPVLSSIPQIKTPGLQSQASLIDNLYNPAIRDYAAQTGITFVDMPLLVDVTQYHSGDLFHYGSTGYTAMADVWFQATKTSVENYINQIRLLNAVAIQHIMLLLLE